MRVCLVALLLLATGAAADTGKLVVAPAGVCAGDERDLALALGSKARAEDSEVAEGSAVVSTPMPGTVPATPAAAPAATMPATLHLSPTQVSSGPSVAGLEPPAPPTFAGPGACDQPGSGCVLERVLEDPDPGTGCGLPGSPCP